MKILERSTTTSADAGTTGSGGSTAEELIIKEARRRQRRRWMLVTIAVVIVVGAIAAGMALADRGAAPPRSSSTTEHPNPVTQFIGQAEKGASGRIHAWYSVTAGPHAGVIEIAQQVAPHDLNPASGTWSFLFQSSQGISSQWIQKGSSSWDCWHFASVSTWHCTGPGTFVSSNGYAESVAPYIPLTASGQLSQLQVALTHRGRVKQIATFAAESKQFGKLSCLKVMAITLSSPETVCIDRDGLIVNIHNASGFFTNVTLLRTSKSIPPAAFVPVGPIAPGSQFSPVPS